MPWKVETVMELKTQFINEALKPKHNISELCRKFGVSRSTGYRLLKRYQLQKDQAFIDQSRRPLSHPSATSNTVTMLILCLNELHPTWGGVKIANYCRRIGIADMPSPKTIARILKRHGRITTNEHEKVTKEWTRFEHAYPNDLWQMDFKGHFKLEDGRCYPLTLLDDHSRYALMVKSCRDQRGKTVKAALIEVFRTYGMPKRMTMDNGAPWGHSGSQYYTSLAIWLMRLGIQVSYSRPGHPQTQGKLERMHRTLKEELLNQYYFADWELAQDGFDWWRHQYNEIRPHMAIDHQVPSERYKVSERVYPEKLAPVEYASELEVRRVQSRGEISYRGKTYKVGSALDGHPVGLQMDEESGLMDVYFCQQKILKLDLEHDMK